MDASEGRLKILDLSKEQLLRLFDLSMGIFPFIRHDIGRALESASLSLTDLQSEVKDHGGKFAFLEQHVLEAVQQLKRARSLYNLLKEFGNSGRHQYMLFAKPAEIVESINRTYGVCDVAVGEGSPMSLEIIYPRNILFGILLELTDNARAHISGPRQIMVRWGLSGDRFECEVHDNGPGIDQRLGEKTFKPLASLRHTEGTMVPEKGVGLSILERIIINNSGGMLLFSKSPLLGGALVRFEFPVDSYQREEAMR